MSSTSASSASSSSGSSSDECTSASERDGAATASTSEPERPSALPVAPPSPVEGPTPPKPKPRRKKRRARKPAPIAVNLVNCKYPLLRTVQKKLGWREVGDDDDWQLYWTDTSVAIERVMKLKPTQKINHFTGMLEICRKKQLAKNLARMSAAFPDEFTFAPKTFILPAEMDIFAEQFRSSTGGKRRRTFILKPDAGCQGKGIALCQNIDQATRALRDLGTLMEDGKPGSTSVVAQKYLTRPFLIDGYKFDLRVYALVLCADPLRVFVFNDGLVRFCTERYAPPKAENLRETCMHLTNYAVNKHNENFVRNTDATDTGGGEGSKWSIQGLRDWMEDEDLDFDEVWADVTDLVVKTIISAQPVLAHNYARVLPPESGNDGYSCFEILGLDVMLDEDLKPWLIEVNHSPSFTADSPLDLSVKEELISDAIELVRIDPRAIKRAQAEEKASSLSRLMGGARVGSNSGAKTADGDPPKTRLTPEEIVERRAACVAARERWEENHSGSFDIAYPSLDFAKQRLYRRLLEGARASFDEHGSHARVRDVLAQAKEKARRRVTEEEVKMLFADRGLRVPYGEKFRRAVEAASGERDATGRVSWASVGPAVKLPLPARPGWDKNTRSDRPIIDASPVDRSIPSAFGTSASAPPRSERPAPVDVPPTGSIPIAARPPPPARASAATLTDHREETLRRLLASREAEAEAAAATAAAKAGAAAPKSPGYYATLKAMLGSRPAPGVAATAPSKGGGKGVFSAIRNAGGGIGGSRGATSSTMTRSTTNSTTKSTKSNASATFDASRAREREKLHAEIVGSIPVASGGFGLASQPKTSRRRDGIAAESRSISAATTGAGTMGVLGAGFAHVSSRRGTRRVAN